MVILFGYVVNFVKKHKGMKVWATSSKKIPPSSASSPLGLVKNAYNPDPDRWARWCQTASDFRRLDVDFGNLHTLCAFGNG